ncbi:MAG TPA: folate-binding protein [Acetobacteraceae bacterium]
MAKIVPKIVPLTSRSVLEVSGADRVSFLQGLVSNDVTEAVPGRAVWAALLTPQGKWLADFFIFAEGGRLLLDCEAGQAGMLAQKLTRFRLRADVMVRPVDLLVHAAWEGDPGAALQAPDPRLAEAGWRVLSVEPLAANGSFEEWDRRRLGLGLPDGSRDLEAEKTTLLEAGFDELHGVSWTKGCYMGQELTARTKYRGLLKRRLAPVRVEGPLPSPGSPVLRGGVEVGAMRSGQGDLGLALLRLDAFGDALDCGEAVLRPAPPRWMALEPVRLAQQPA